MNNLWTSESWRAEQFVQKQQPNYPDSEKYQAVIASLKKKTPLVFAGEVRNLKAYLAKVEAGQAFLLQGGDCAETFSHFSPNRIRDIYKLFLQMSISLTYSLEKHVVKVGRLAGQFAKPRSEPIETRDGVSLDVYRGDIVNGIDFSKASRTPNPELMLQAYDQSVQTMNLIRAYTVGGLADLSKVNKWNLDFVDSYLSDKYKQITANIQKAIHFMKACGIEPSRHSELHTTDFFVSHEALLLGYEEGLMRKDETLGDTICTSGHLLWIGNRTRMLNSAHVELLRGVANPIGIKIDGKDIEEVCEVIKTLNPNKESGKIVLISRCGKDKISSVLPPMIQAVKKHKLPVIWSCDPMHGNTKKTDVGVKTRSFADILDEIEAFFAICQSESVYPGGIHLEMTSDDVTECVGGVRNIQEQGLLENYQTFCDPRLNANQSIEIAFKLSELVLRG